MAQSEQRRLQGEVKRLERQKGDLVAAFRKQLK